MMLKKALCRSALGAPLGICIGYLIALIISGALGTGEFQPCAPALIERFDSEMSALIFQTVLSGILGVSFAAASIIWEIETWSIVRQTGVYFLVAAVTMLPTAWFAGWMEHSLPGFLSYLAVFVGIFIVMWVIQSLIWRKKIRRINDTMRR